jgi:glycosyltransferase involved in cell wall biosynthesis
VMSDGVTGYVCQDEDEMAARCVDVVDLDRFACRSHVETHFSIERMADGYEEAYRRAIAQSRRSSSRSVRSSHGTGRLAS